MDELKAIRWRQRFEYTFELSWKTMKDYLESQGVAVSYPREVLKEAFAHGLVEDGEVWMEMLERRNMLAHTYDEKTFATAFRLACGTFHTAITALVERLGKAS